MKSNAAKQLQSPPAPSLDDLQGELQSLEQQIAEKDRERDELRKALPRAVAARLGDSSAASAEIARITSLSDEMRRIEVRRDVIRALIDDCVEQQRVEQQKRHHEECVALAVSLRDQVMVLHGQTQDFASVAATSLGRISETLRQFSQHTGITLTDELMHLLRQCIAGTLYIGTAPNPDERKGAVCSGLFAETPHLLEQGGHVSFQRTIDNHLAKSGFLGVVRPQT